MFVQSYKGIDFDLVFSANDLFIEGQPKNKYSQYSINYNGNNRQIDRKTGLIIEKMMKERPVISANNSDIYQIKHAEIEKYYLNQLQPVDVVAKAPVKNNKKMLLFGVIVIAALFVLISPKKRKR